MNSSAKIVLLGGAGLVGQNLTIKLIEAGYVNLLVVDKSQSNLAVLRQLHPEVSICCADISEDGEWTKLVGSQDTIVMLQAQIGGLHLSEFERNNLLSTRRVLEICKREGITRIVHVSSSVVNSAADDFYTRTKTSQENMVLQSNIDSVILRPTLMFGWFDRKHLGWLSRFMKKVPVFPIPGNGRYMRQPLYVGDFADVLLSCIRDSSISGIYDISGLEKIDYIDIIKAIRDETKSRAIVVKIPYKMFQFLLNLWAKFDSNPPFTKQQLEALVTRDDFEVIDWPSIFQVSATPFRKAISETFNHPSYSNVVLEF
jgi:nucleoside-diphosphate-sugar epimerase